MSAATGTSDGVRPLRADARRNRARILAAARDVFVEQGLAAPLDAIAQRADVGIATLYRRFPDRDALLREIALETFESVTAAAEQAVSGPDHRATIVLRFFQQIVELRLGVLVATLFPVIEAQVRNDEEVADAAAQLGRTLDDLVGAAHAAGELREDVTADDLVGLLALLTRPLPGMPHAYAEQLTPRLLHLLAEGLGTAQATPAPPPPDPLEEWAGLPR